MSSWRNTRRTKTRDTALLVLGRPSRQLLTAAAASAGAELCAAALLGVAGWFLATSAAAGLGILTFSWVAPSAWVRSFAVGRTGLRYVGAVSSHAATLEQQTAARAAVLAGAAEQLRRNGRSYARRWRSEQVQSALTRDLAALQVAPLRMGLPALSATITAIVGICALTWIAPITAAAVAMGLLGHGLLLRAAVHFDSKDTARRVAAAQTALAEATTSAVEGWPELWTFRSVDAAKTHVLNVAQNYEKARAELSRRQVLLDSRAPLLARIAVLTGVAITSWLTPNADVPTRVAAALLGLAVLEVTGSITGPWVEHPRLAHAAQRLHAVTSGQPDVAVRAPALHVDDMAALTSSRAGEQLLRDLVPGASVVLMGRSGVGKTTLLQFISVRRPDALLVADDWAVIEASVGDNLRLADPHADDERLQWALDVAGLRCVIDDAASWPSGLATTLGRHGRALSGGERRRVALAQAVLLSPPLLLLDEPTEGLDPDAARHVMAGVRAALPDTTIVAVIHDRLAHHLPDSAWAIRHVLTDGRLAAPQGCKDPARLPEPARGS